ncbi:MAG: PQQ-dependent sugar dehydrogenase [Planctomycetales bacterium]|nr:PQQ-dependent sugar dehydrogenase [Planctomycetales bacterium]
MPRMPLATLCVAILLLSLVQNAIAAYRVERVLGNLDQPTYVTQAPGDDNALYVVLRNDGANQLGRILKYDQFSQTSETFLDLTGGIESDGGVLTMAFHPNYQENGLFYVVTNADRVNGLDEYRVVDGSPTFQRRLLQYDNLANNFHTLNWIGFRPQGNANELFVTAGDGGTQADQNSFNPTLIESVDSPYGKVMRIDVSAEFTTPAAGPMHPGIDVVALGLRNPYRASFDRATGDMYLGDVGFNTVEEIDFLSAATIADEASWPIDFGWTAREGTIANPASGVGGPAAPADIEPIFDFVHPGNNVATTLPHVSQITGNSVTGGYVYRGPIDELQGQYFFAPLYDNSNSDNIVYSAEFDRTIAASEFNGDNFTNLQNRTVELENLVTGGAQLRNITSFGEDNQGNLYLVKFGDGFFPPLGTGEIFRIVTGSPRIRSDLNSDGVIDAADWSLFAISNGSDLSHLSPDDAFAHGDVDFDGDNDYDDFRIFKGDYIAANGSAAFTALGAVIPEPISSALCVAVAATALRRRSRQRQL